MSKYNFYSTPAEKLDWQKIYKLSTDSDYETRLELTEFLAGVNNEHSEIVLLTLACDEDRLVRASACDSLYFSSSADIFMFLLNKTKTDSDFLVRGYAAMSAGDILSKLDIDSISKNEFISQMKKVFLREKSRWTKTSIAYALCVNGQSEYLNYIAEASADKKAQYRMQALNTLIDLTENYNIRIPPDVIDILTANKDKETNAVVLEKFETVLNIKKNSLEKEYVDFLQREKNLYENG